MNELQPQIVLKLQEGRNKRIKFCEKTYQSRRKDLEQRSLETCVVSSTALEGFKTKAEKKLLEAEGEIKKAVEILNSMLQPS